MSRHSQPARKQADAMPALEPQKSEIAIATRDGFPLAATLFEGDGAGPLVLISSATAVPRGLYSAFASACVAAGARAALVYDYRGTGGSARPAGWSKRISKKDWALIDLPAAAARLDAVAPGHAMVGAGQSFGGQALGLSGIASRFERYLMVATMSGHFAGLDDRWAKVKMLGFGVPMSFLFRDMPKGIGVGEPIPSTVFRDWARWCSMPDYFFDDPTLPETARYEDVTLPILSIGLTDDVWGTPRATDALMKHYVNATVERRWLSPEDAGGQPIGHLGFFRSRFAQTLWPQIVAWLLYGMPVTIGTPRE
jgi:predicted alpha/beta hydrolase